MSEETLPISDSASSDTNESESETPGGGLDATDFPADTTGDKTGDRATGVTDLRG